MPNSSNHSDPDKPATPLNRRLAGGVVLEVAGNRPLYAVNDDDFWIVTKGEIDVFAAKVEEGIPAGARTHLFRAGKGAFLFGVADRDRRMGLVGVGKPGTELTRFDQRELTRAAASDYLTEAAAGLETWIDNLSRAITRSTPPSGNYLDIAYGTTVSSEADQIIRSRETVLWVQPVSGKLILAGDPELPPLNPQIPFPLTRHLWFQTEEPTEIRGTATKELLVGDKFNTALNSFHDMVLQCIAVGEIKRETHERANFDRRISEDRRTLQSALFRLGATLFKKSPPARVSPETGASILAASKAVAEAAKIPVENLTESLVQESGPLQLEQVARAGNFFTRRVILKEGWSGEDNGPLLGRIQDEKSHRYVALLPLSPRRYELFDPESGTRELLTRKLEEGLDPQAHTFYRPLPPKSLSVKDIVQFTFSGAWKDMIMVIGVGVAGALLALLIPIMTGVIIDTVIPEAARGQLLQIGLILTVSVFTAFMFQITRAIATVRMEGKMDSTLQAAVIDRLLALPAPFFRKFTAGDLANRAMGINQIREILSGATLTAALTCVFSSFNLILMFWYDWKLALVGLGLILVTFCISAALSVWMVRYQRQVFAIQGKNAGIVLQLLTGIAKLRMTGTEDRAFGVWAESFSEKKAIDFKSGKINAALDTTTSFIPLVATMVIFWFFLRSQMSGLSTGHFLAFNAAFSGFQNAVVQATLTFASLLHVIPLWERAQPILSTIPEVNEGKTTVNYLSGEMGVDHVSFRYSETGPRVLKDVNLNISPGEFVAIVGGSGSGKSTLLRILLGFETPESGVIYYDGQDMEDLDVKSIRRQMGVVLQNGQVMPGSILKNITGALDLPLDDAWEAARMVDLDKDIKAMPMGMHTVVSAGGGNLSGGQRQRLIIARAIVRRPRILFFDEATSALDNHAQAIVSKSIEGLNVTRVVIAHRLSTIIKADRIYALDRGKMRESGTYDELMKSKGFFYELARRQIA